MLNDAHCPHPSPTFSVVIPVYNGRAHIEETVRSVLAQTYAAKEILVVEDGSPIDSAELVQQFPPVTYVPQSNTGVSGARNHGAAIASSEWICFLDQDDILLPNHLEQFVSELQNQVNADLIYTPRLLLVERAGSWVTEATSPSPAPSLLPKTLLDRCPFPPSGVCVKKTVFRSVGGFLDRYNLAEDWEFWLRCLAHGCTFAQGAAPTVCYRVHSQSNSHRPIPILQANARVIRERIVPLLSWPMSLWHGFKLLSKQEAEAAILLRQLHQEGARSMMLRSILRFPIGDLRRYKILSHMLLSMLRPVHTVRPSTT